MSLRARSSRACGSAGESKPHVRTRRKAQHTQLCVVHDAWLWHRLCVCLCTCYAVYLHYHTRVHFRLTKYLVQNTVCANLATASCVSCWLSILMASFFTWDCFNRMLFCSSWPLSIKSLLLMLPVRTGVEWFTWKWSLKIKNEVKNVHHESGKAAVRSGLSHSPRAVILRNKNTVPKAVKRSASLKATRHGGGGGVMGRNG